MHAKLERRLRRRIDLTITDNRVVMYSHGRKGRRLRVRVHHMFLEAGSEELDALALWIRRKDPEARKILNAYVRENRYLIRERWEERDPDPGGLARGEVYDLHRIYSDLNRRFFNNRVKARIQWGPRISRRRRRSIKLGQYIEEDRRIVISPALDRRSVPRYMVEWVVYHEMLHDLLGFKVINGVNYAHFPEFRRQEQQYPHYRRATDWEERNLDKLLAA